MSDQDESSATQKLERLEAILHIDERHPQYEYAKTEILASEELFNDVQFALINGWEINRELNDLQGIQVVDDVTAKARGYTAAAVRYFRRLKQAPTLTDSE